MRNFAWKCFFFFKNVINNTWKTRILYEIKNVVGISSKIFVIVRNIYERCSSSLNSSWIFKENCRQGTIQKFGHNCLIVFCSLKKKIRKSFEKKYGIENKTKFTQEKNLSNILHEFRCQEEFNECQKHTENL